MSTTSGIEWTEATWNPTVGCTPVSPGCANCYACHLHGRLAAMGQSKYADPFSTVRPWRDHLDLPHRWAASRVIFVNSMSDLFHEDIPDGYIQEVFEVMQKAELHTFQVLTKRAARLSALAQSLPWPENVWMGVSVENAAFVSRIGELRKVPASVRFLSVEPLLGSLGDINLNGIDWVIVGGESGKKARPLRAEWVREVRDACQSQGVAFFFKQWGKLKNNPDRHDTTAKRGNPRSNGQPKPKGKSKTLAKGGRTLDGRTWDERPTPTLRWQNLQALPPVTDEAETRDDQIPLVIDHA